MKVLLTGALGSIGLATLAALLQEGHDVVAFDLESPRARSLASGFDGRAHFVWGDITNPESLRHALDGVAAVIHLAAVIPPYSDKAPELARRVNLDATYDLIEQMEASPTAKRLVFASSQGILGDIQDREPPLRVDTPVSPDRRIRAPQGRMRASDPAVGTAVEHPTAFGGHSTAPASAGSQHHVRDQPRRAIRIPPSRRRRNGIRSRRGV